MKSHMTVAVGISGEDPPIYALHVKGFDYHIVDGLYRRIGFDSFLQTFRGVCRGYDVTFDDIRIAGEKPLTDYELDELRRALR